MASTAAPSQVGGASDSRGAALLLLLLLRGVLRMGHLCMQHTWLCGMHVQSPVQRACCTGNGSQKVGDVPGYASAGSGVIVHQSDRLGLVVTDRNTVPVSVGDVLVSFGAHPAEVEARIRFLHPLHNFTILSYDPADLPPEVRRSLSMVLRAYGVALM